MQEQIMFLGGASSPHSIGQQCTVIVRNIYGELRRIMIDCGSEFKREEETGGFGPFPDFSLLNGAKVDATVFSHFHTDHVGAAAYLIAKGYAAEDMKYVMSPQTGAVLPFVLQDGLKHDPEYTVFDAVEVLARREIIPHPGECELLPGLKVWLEESGHTPGAFSIVIPTSSGKKGLITGDICWHDQPVTRGALLPSKTWPREWIPDEIWGTDLTYGIGTKKPFHQEVERLIVSTKTALDAGKTVVIAAFGNGRGQNVASWLSKILKKSGWPIFVDGVTRDILEIFRTIQWSKRNGMLPGFAPKSGLFRIESPRHREEVIKSVGPKVVITTGGMGDFGPIVRYLEEGLGRDDWVFFFTSWLAQGTNGERLLRAKRRGHETFPLVVRGGERKILKLCAGIDRFHLSGHGSLDEFTRFVEDIVGCRNGELLDRLVLTHGTPETKREAALRLARFAKEIIYGERNTVLSL